MRNIETRIFEKLLIHIGKNNQYLPNDIPLTSFLAMEGNLYNQELMVIGRAVNGWVEKWSPNELLDTNKIKDIVDKTLTSVSDHSDCPMSWVSGLWGNTEAPYNTKRSAFWRVIRQVVGHLEIADIDKPDWPSILTWSNLYKVSPWERGNPSSKLRSTKSM